MLAGMHGAECFPGGPAGTREDACPLLCQERPAGCRCVSIELESVSCLLLLYGAMSCSGATPSQMHDMRSVAVNASRLALAGAHSTGPTALRPFGRGLWLQQGTRQLQPAGLCIRVRHEPSVATCISRYPFRAAVKHGLHTHVRHQSPRLFSHITCEDGTGYMAGRLSGPGLAELLTGALVQVRPSNVA